MVTHASVFHQKREPMEEEFSYDRRKLHAKGKRIKVESFKTILINNFVVLKLKRYDLQCQPSDNHIVPLEIGLRQDRDNVKK